MQSELERNLQQQLGDIQTRGQQAAFQQAQQAFEQQKQRQLAGGQQMAGMAPIQSGVQFKELGALAGIGEQQRQQQQKALDLGFQQFREEQTYPEASLQQYQSIIRGFPLQPTTTQTQQSILPTPSLGQQLIGMGTGALGLAGAAKTLFKEGGQLKPIPEDNKGLPNLPTEVRNKMGFMKKGKRPKITKKQNKMYKEMLYAMLSDGKRKDMNGDISEIADIMKEKGISTLSKDGGVVKLQPGGQVYEAPSVFSYGDITSTEIQDLLERAKARSKRADELGMVMSDEERQKQIEEDKSAAKLRAYMQLAQLGGDILAADPSRGTLAAVGSAASKAAPGFMEAAKEFKDVERKARKEKIEEATKQISVESTLDKDVLDILKTDADYKAAIQKAGDLGLSIVGDVKRITDIVKGTLSGADQLALDSNPMLQTNEGEMNLAQITTKASERALQKIRGMNLYGTDKETVFNNLLIKEVQDLGIGGLENLKEGGLIPATKEQKTVSQILDEIE